MLARRLWLRGCVLAVSLLSALVVWSAGAAVSHAADRTSRSTFDIGCSMTAFSAWLAPSAKVERRTVKCLANVSSDVTVVYRGAEEYSTAPVDGRYVKGKLVWSFAVSESYLDGMPLDEPRYHVEGYSSYAGANHTICFKPISITAAAARTYATAAVGSPSPGVLEVRAGGIPWNITTPCASYFTANFTNAAVNKLFTAAATPHFSVSCKGHTGAVVARDFNFDKTATAGLDFPGIASKETIRVRSQVWVEFGTRTPVSFECDWPTHNEIEETLKSPPLIDLLIKGVLGGMI